MCHVSGTMLSIHTESEVIMPLLLLALKNHTIYKCSKGDFISSKGLQSSGWPSHRLGSKLPAKSRRRHLEGGAAGVGALC